jgi:catechol 2,3-dioxygenase-like lactoylglutathione lyase family enzyme
MDSFTRGVHHLALCTDDMKKTVDFYVGVLGMPLVHAMKVPPGLGTGPTNRGNPPYENIRHYFFDMGNDSLLAFFEIPRGREPQANRNAIGGMQHCAFVVTPSRLAEIAFTEDQFHNPELLLGAARAGLRVLDVPVTIRRRTAGTSKKGTNVRYGIGFLRVMVKTWLR